MAISGDCALGKLFFSSPEISTFRNLGFPLATCDMGGKESCRYLLFLSSYVMSNLETPWRAACQASFPFTIYQQLLKLMFIESVMLSNHLVLCHLLLLLPSIFSSIRVFSNESYFTLAGQSTGASASPLVLSMNIQDWFPLGLTGWSPWCPKDFQESSPAPHFKNIKYVDIISPKTRRSRKVYQNSETAK